MGTVFEELRELARGDVPVLITGETGVGKELVARILHASSVRGQGPFVALNCSAIPGELLESELFGIEAGVASGVSARSGKMRSANRGVLFLDEVGDLAPALQGKLLRALQEEEVQPLGSRHPIPVDVRVLSATNRDLLGDNTFRDDLYYRLAGYVLEVPPLRARREEIPALCGLFLERFSREVNKIIPGISTRALAQLVKAPWPGNIRQLSNTIRSLVYRCSDGMAIESSILPANLVADSLSVALDSVDNEKDLDLAGRIETLERTLIVLALERCEGNKSEAARRLGLSRNGLAKKIARLGLGTPNLTTK
jgi:transcriptional regulator with PAS, ATPase and Fis domain